MLYKPLVREGKGEQRLFALTVGLACASGGLVIVQAHYITAMLNGVIFGRQGLAQAQPLLVILLAVMVVRALAAWGASLVARRLGLRIKHALRTRLVRHLLTLGPIAAGSRQPGELVNLLTDGLDQIEPYFTRYLPQLVTAVLIPAILLCIFFSLDWITALIFLITAILLPVFMILIGQLATQQNRRQWEQLSRLSAHFLDVVRGLPTLVLFGRSRDQIRVITAMTGEFRSATMNVLRVAFLSAFVLELFATLGTAMVAVTVGLKLLYGTLSFSQAFFILLLAPEFYLPLRLLGSHFHTGMSGVTVAEECYRLLAVPSLPQGGAMRPAGGNAPEIRFHQVSFAYANGTRTALRAVDFVIRAGEKVALVGTSGAGKSTVAKLLLRFMLPNSGQILIDGLPLAELERDGWLQQIAYIPATPHIFFGTVAENIALGTTDVSHDAVVKAAMSAGAHEFISLLPDGYATLVGQGGRPLSGGEGQRLAIARAFLREAAVIIMDEPTTALDPLHEASVMQAVQSLLAGKTALIIAHRLHTVKRMDRIVVMEAGTVMESGTHQELLDRRAGYYRLVVAGGGEA